MFLIHDFIYQKEEKKISKPNKPYIENNNKKNKCPPF